MLKKCILSIIFLACSAGISQAQKQGTESGFRQDVTKVGTAAAPFLEIGTGARATAMGGAFTSIADDPTALYWNTAGIARIPGINFGFYYADWLANLEFSNFAAVASLGGLGGVGAYVTYLNYGDQPVRTIAFPEGTGELYGANDLAMGLAVALNLTDRFSIGLGGKYIHQQIWNEQASGFAMDLGALYNTPLEGLQLGGSISNFGTEMTMDGRDLLRTIDVDPLHYNNDRIITKLNTDAFDLPLLFRFGLSYRLLNSTNQKLIIATDVLVPSNDTETINFGAEYLFKRTFALRIGYDSLYQEDSITGLTMGAGVRVRQVRSFVIAIDYTYKYFDFFDAVNMVSVGIQL